MTSTGPGEIWQAIELNQDYLPIFRESLKASCSYWISRSYLTGVQYERDSRDLKRNVYAKLKKRSPKQKLADGAFITNIPGFSSSWLFVVVHRVGALSHRMITSSYANIYNVTGPLCGEFTGHRWIPITKASDAELWYFLWSVPEHSIRQTLETPVIWVTKNLIMTWL